MTMPSIDPATLTGPTKVASKELAEIELNQWIIDQLKDVGMVRKSILLNARGRCPKNYQAITSRLTALRKVGIIKTLGTGTAGMRYQLVEGR